MSPYFTDCIPEDFSFYVLRRKVKYHSFEIVPFAHFEKRFDTARSDYHFIRYNCYHWARDFYYALTTRDFPQPIRR